MATFRLDRSTDANGTSERIVDDHGVIALVKARGKAVEAGPLLAAAPDMLAALKGLVENPAFELGSPKVDGRAGGEKRAAAVNAWDCFVEDAHTAIAKAEGRS